MHDEAPQGPSKWVGHVMSQLAGGVRQETAEALAPLGLTPILFGCLEAIAAAGPLSQVALGQMVRVDRTTIVQLLDVLEGAGLAERRPDPSDRRVHAVSLTKLGFERLEHARAAAHAAEAAFLAPLSEQEREALIRVLRKLYAARTDASCGA
ncbi:MAG: MarR family transcriptional regulator [Chitinophagales bacterium]|nr:MarR family transcriptional regulator [Hyphomicrobiales bacterium]